MNEQQEALVGMLQVAVPLWYRNLNLPGSLAEHIASGETSRIASDLAHYGEYLFHAPRVKSEKGRSANAFNDLARGLAILSAVPGGVELFGFRWKDGNPTILEGVDAPKSAAAVEHCKKVGIQVIATELSAALTRDATNTGVRSGAEKRRGKLGKGKKS